MTRLLPTAIKNTGRLFRVFFVIACISLIGIIWQFQGSFNTIIKSPGGSFTEGIIGAPRFINPVLAQSQSDKDLTALIFEPLVSINQNGDIDFKLAESLEISPDGKTYTLGLKPNLYFHDKEAITAEDVIFTIEKIQDPLLKSPLASRWSGVDIEQSDNSTIVFNLVQPYSDFVHNLEIGILPKHIWETVGAQEFIFSTYNTHPIGSGAYKVAHVSEKENGVPQSYTLKRANNSYIDQITFIFFDNAEALQSAYKKGTIDAMYGFSPNETDSKMTEQEHFFTGTLPRVFGIFFNQSEQAIFQDKNIRQAINYAIDRQDMVAQIFDGYAQASDSPFAPTESTLDYDPQKAHELIQSSKWELDENQLYTKTIDGEEKILEFSISIPNTNEMQEVANLIKQNLRSVGINVTIRSFDQGNLSQNVIRPREYESLLFGYEIEKTSDMYAFWHSSQRNDPGLNISLYANNAVDKELTTLRTNKEEADIEKIIEEIQNDLPAVFLYSPSFTYVLPPRVKIDKDLTHLTNASERFDAIASWYIRTRRVWNIFVQ